MGDSASSVADDVDDDDDDRRPNLVLCLDGELAWLYYRRLVMIYLSAPHGKWQGVPCAGCRLNDINMMPKMDSFWGHGAYKRQDLRRFDSSAKFPACISPAMRICLVSDSKM